MYKLEILTNWSNRLNTLAVLNCQESEWIIINRPFGDGSILPQEWTKRLLGFVLPKDSYLAKSTPEIDDCLARLKAWQEDEYPLVEVIQKWIEEAPKVTTKITEATEYFTPQHVCDLIKKYRLSYNSQLWKIEYAADQEDDRAVQSYDILLTGTYRFLRDLCDELCE